MLTLEADPFPIPSIILGYHPTTKLMPICLTSVTADPLIVMGEGARGITVATPRTGGVTVFFTLNVTISRNFLLDSSGSSF